MYIIGTVRYNSLRAKRKEREMSNRKGGGVQSDNLGEIRFTGAPELELPNVDLTDLSPEKLEETARKTKEKAKEVERWVTTFLGNVKAVRQLTREAQELVADQVTEKRQHLQDLLDSETPAYRRAAWKAYLLWHICNCPCNFKAAKQMLEKLVEDGYMEEDSEGVLEIWDRYYSVPHQSAFGEEENDQVQEALSNLQFQVGQKTRQQKRNRAAELREQGEISPQELLEGKAGKCFLPIPPEYDERRDFWRRGGNLLVRQDEQGRIWPLEATGGIENAICEAVGMNVFLLGYSLSWENPPSVKNLPDEENGKIRLLWFLINRAIEAVQEEEEMKNLREEFQEDADITDREFFLERRTGTCLIHFQGKWENRDGSEVPYLFFLAERGEEEGETTIHLVEIPEHLEKLFSECQENYPEGGDHFEDVPQPLRAVLQACFGQVQRASHMAEEE